MDLTPSVICWKQQDLPTSPGEWYSIKKNWWTPLGREGIQVLLTVLEMCAGNLSRKGCHPTLVMTAHTGLRRVGQNTALCTHCCCSKEDLTESELVSANLLSHIKLLCRLAWPMHCSISVPSSADHINEVCSKHTNVNTHSTSVVFKANECGGILSAWLDTSKLGLCHIFYFREAGNDSVLYKLFKEYDIRLRP